MFNPFKAAWNGTKAIGTGFKVGGQGLWTGTKWTGDKLWDGSKAVVGAPLRYNPATLGAKYLARRGAAEGQDQINAMPQVKKIGITDTAQEYKKLAAGINPDQGGINAYRQLANGEYMGPSQGTQFALADAAKQNAINMGNAETMAASQSQSAMDSMAANGGLSAGQRERMLGQGAYSSLMAKQQQGASYGSNRLSTLGADANQFEQNKVNAQMGLAGQELAQADFQRGKLNDYMNLRNAYEDRRLKRDTAYDLANEQRNQNINDIKNRGFLTKVWKGIF